MLLLLTLLLVVGTWADLHVGKSFDQIPGSSPWRYSSTEWYSTFDCKQLKLDFCCERPCILANLFIESKLLSSYLHCTIWCDQGKLTKQSRGNWQCLSVSVICMTYAIYKVSIIPLWFLLTQSTVCTSKIIRVVVCSKWYSAVGGRLASPVCSRYFLHVYQQSDYSQLSMLPSFSCLGMKLSSLCLWVYSCTYVLTCKCLLGSEDSAGIRLLIYSSVLLYTTDEHSNKCVTLDSVLILWCTVWLFRMSVSISFLLVQ